MEEVIFPTDQPKKSQMERYMRHQFTFCGLQSKERLALSQTLLKESKQLEMKELLSLITYYYAKEEREYQYLAIDLAKKNVARFSVADLKQLSQLIMEKSWWDSVDNLSAVISSWLLKHMESFDEVFSWFYQHENMWMRRVSIIMQLKLKERTQTSALEKTILFD